MFSSNGTPSSKHSALTLARRAASMSAMIEGAYSSRLLPPVLGSFTYHLEPSRPMVRSMLTVPSVKSTHFHVKPHISPSRKPIYIARANPTFSGFAGSRAMNCATLARPLASRALGFLCACLGFFTPRVGSLTSLSRSTACRMAERRLVRHFFTVDGEYFLLSFVTHAATSSGVSASSSIVPILGAI